jgi:hypothetical protein
MVDVHLHVEVEPGAIEVEGIHGHVTDKSFVLYVTLREKDAAAEVVCENPGIVNIFATHQTTTPVGEDGEGTRRFTPDEMEEPTTIVLPEGWYIGVDLSKHTCRIIGVRHVDVKRLKRVEFTTMAR